MESHLEARLWNDVFTHAQEALGIPHGTVRATVLIETIPAAFEMEEILYELRDHASGLNAGRWDYLFSIIKYFRDAGADFVLPDRNDVTMTAPFMRAYTELLVRTCHKRGAFAMGGMAAFIPNRRDPEVTEKALAQGARRQAARGRRRVRRLVGRAPRPRADLRRGVRPRCSATGRTSSTGCATDVSVTADAAARRQGHAGRGHRGRAARGGRRRRALPRVVAGRQRRGRDPQPDGGRGDRGDLPVAGVAVGAQRRRARHRRQGDRRPRARGARARSAPRSPTSVPAEYLEPAVELFEQVALADEFPDFLTLPAYERI